MIKDMSAITPEYFKYRLEKETKQYKEKIERLNNIINKAREKSLYLQKRYGYILDDLTYLLMQGKDEE